MRRQIFLRTLAFFECLVLVMFFHQGLSANPVSRLLTVFAVVEDHRLEADRWASQTIDKAFVHGRVYSDKAPLSSAIVIPFYAVWRAAHRRADQGAYEDAAVHLGDFVAAAIPFALFAVMLLRRASARIGPSRAFPLALVAAFSTPLFNYGNIYYGHMLAGTLLLASYVAAVERGRFALAGFVGGCAVLTEYPLLVPVAVLFVWSLTVRRGPRRALAFAAGGLAPAVALLAYNVAITGHPFDFPYSHVSDTWKAMRTSFGIRWPSPEAGWELVFGQYRGLLFYAPTLAVLAPLALGKPAARAPAEPAPAERTPGEPVPAERAPAEPAPAERAPAERAPAEPAPAEPAPAERAPGEPAPAERRTRWLLVVLSGLHFLFVCSYFKWDGGWCTGPRHLTPAIVLWVYAGLGRLADEWPRRRIAFYVLGALGIFVNLAAAATNPIPAEDATHPLFDVFLPSIAARNINGHNLAVECGLPNGPWLLVVWAAAFTLAAVTPPLAAVWSRRLRRSPVAPTHAPLAELEGRLPP